MNKAIKTTLTIFLLANNFILAQHIYYTKKEIKDSIHKYSNVFETYEKLKYGNRKEGAYIIPIKINYDSIKSDDKLKSHFIKLLDLDNYRKYIIDKDKKEILKRISSKEFNTYNYIENFVNNTYSKDSIQVIMQSIYNNNTLYQKYLNSAVEYENSQYEKYIGNKLDEHYIWGIINFLYPTQWKEVLLFTQNYCSSPSSDNEYCTRILIEMNDIDYTEKYKKYFTNKLSSKTITYNDYLFLKRLHLNKKFIEDLYTQILLEKQDYDLYQIDGSIIPVKISKNKTLSLKCTAFQEILKLYNIDNKANSPKDCTYNNLISYKNLPAQ